VRFFCVFLENDKTNLRQIFFSELWRKHLFITAFIQKQCTRLLALSATELKNYFNSLSKIKLKFSSRRYNPSPNKHKSTAGFFKSQIKNKQV